MDDIDDTDREILRLLVEDGRRPYSDIAEEVGLSGPAVSDRVDRLRERGLLRGFTADVDRSMLRHGREVLAELRVEPGRGTAVESALSGESAVDHRYRTADERVVVTATVPEGDLASVLADAGVLEDVREYDVHLLASADRSTDLGGIELAPACAECGNTVDAEGASARIDGDTYYFCCASCEAAFTDRYESLREGAG